MMVARGGGEQNMIIEERMGILLPGYVNRFGGHSI
jgi:hypothetical protein